MSEGLPMTLDLSSPALWAKTALIGALLVVLFTHRKQQSAASRRAAHQAAIEAAMALAQSAGKGQAAVGGAGQPTAGKDTGGDRPALTVLFASQTGTSEGFATAVAVEARQQGFEPTVACVEDYVDEDIEQLYEEKLLVLIAATYGEGEPTDDALQFTKWLQSDEVEVGRLSDLRYAVFGLGDRSYEKFCEMGHVFHRRLGELGGVALLDAGEGDDSADIEADFASWKRQMWRALRVHAFGQEAGAALTYALDHDGDTYKFEFPAPYQPQFTATLAPASGDEPAPLRASLNPLIDGKPWVKATVKEIRELHTKRSPRSCMHVELDLAQAAKTSLLHTRYEAGDHVALLSENDPAHCAALCRRLRCEMSDTLKVVADVNSGNSVRKYILPTPCSVRKALTSFLDLARPPSQQLLLVLAEHATDETEKSRLLRLASLDGSEQYAQSVVAEQRNLLEVLQQYGSVDISLTRIVEHLPRLQPRFYSISSSPRAHKQEVHVTAALVEYEKPGQEKGRVYEGLATGWMRRLMQRKGGGQGHQLRAYLRKSPFKLPRASTQTMLPTPCILIGPGTGLAPFRGFLHERRAAGDSDQTTLYFGCRSEHEDYIYREELEEFVKDKTLSALHVAFSRDSQEKVYVQDLLRRDRAKIYRQIEQDKACIFVCGDAKHMAADVAAALHEIVETEGGLEKAQAAKYVADLKKAGRYLQDVW